MIACNSEGVWNETGAALAFEVQPHFYQTWFFKIIAGVMLVGGISFGVRRAATRKYRRKLAFPVAVGEVISTSYPAPAWIWVTSVPR